MIKCNLSTIMGARKLNRKQVAAMSGVSRDTIADLYNDDLTRLDKRTLSALCKSLNLTVPDLLEYIED